MRVLFVFPDLSSTVTGYTGVVNYGLASLSAVLRQAGHDIRLFHMTHNPTEEEFRETVRAAQPGLVAFSPTEFSWKKRDNSGAIGSSIVSLAPASPCTAIPELASPTIRSSNQLVAWIRDLGALREAGVGQAA